MNFPLLTAQKNTSSIYPLYRLGSHLQHYYNIKCRVYGDFHVSRAREEKKSGFMFLSVLCSDFE